MDRGTGTERREQGRNKQGNTEGTEAATVNLLLVIKFKTKTKTQDHKTNHPNKGRRNKKLSNDIARNESHDLIE